MTRATICVLALTILGGFAASHAAAAPLPEVGRDWRVASTRPDKSGIAFVDAAHRLKIEGITRFPVLLVLREPTDDLWGRFDRRLTIVGVECATKRHWIDNVTSWLGRELVPPPPVRAVNNLPAPEPGSAMDRVLRMGCAETPLSEATITDPAAWARDALGR